MKTPENDFFRDCRQLIALVQRRHPAALPTALITAILESAFPFVNIIFGALVLDRLLAGGEGVLVWWMIGLDFALGCSSRVLSWLCRAEALTADELALGAVTEKCLTMDYQQLETQSIMDKKTKAEEGSGTSGGFFDFIWGMTETTTWNSGTLASATPTRSSGACATSAVSCPRAGSWPSPGRSTRTLLWLSLTSLPLPWTRSASMKFTAVSARW